MELNNNGVGTPDCKIQYAINTSEVFEIITEHVSYSRMMYQLICSIQSLNRFQQL